MNDEEDDDLVDEIHEEIKLSDTVSITVDVFEFYQEAELLLSLYGMGGARSFSEYCGMLEDEDPVVINSLITALRFRKTKEQEAISGNKSGGRSSSGGGTKYNKHARSDNTDPSDVSSLIMQHGYSRTEIEKARKKHSNKENKDYSWLTKDRLFSMSQEEFDNLSKEMHTYTKSSTRFKLDMSNLKGLK